jgi:beta-glucuronidase
MLVRILQSLLLVVSLYAPDVHAFGTFSEYPVFPDRNVISLEGTWQFAWLGPIPDVLTFSPTNVITDKITVVPSSFDLLPYPGKQSLVGQRGAVLYRTTINTNPNTFARIRFGACGLFCSVWVDGIQVGTHGGNGYTAFWIGGIAPSAKKTRTLEIIADNRFNYTTAILHSYVDDWYQFGGLYRSIEWHELGPSVLSTVAFQNVDILQVNPTAGIVDARIRLHDPTETSKLNAKSLEPGQDAPFYAPRYRKNGGDSLVSLSTLPSRINVTVFFDDNESESTSFNDVEIDEHGIGMITGLIIPNKTLWSIDSPTLHTLHMTISSSNNGEANDYIIERFGLRSFTTCTQGDNLTAALCLNGSPVKLKGYGRHDTNPGLGHALGLMDRLKDYLLMQGLGSNFVRIGHYTQDRSFSSIADSLGFLAWTETIGWDSQPSTYKDQNWIAASLAAIEEHVNDTFNHPSTVMMAYINEGTSDDPTVCPTYAILNAKYKSLSINALTGYASDKGIKDVCIKPSGADFIGLNIYAGWYDSVDPTGGTGTGNIQNDIEGNIALIPLRLNEFATFMTTNHSSIPFFISELGAGAIPGWVDPMNAIWTENYAGRVVGTGADVALSDERWSGIAVWQLMDQRVYVIGEGVLGRPRGFNNKGTFDENRKAKLPLYSAVYNAFHNLPQPDWLRAVYPNS